MCVCGGGGGGGGGELPSHLEDCKCGVCMSMCVTVSE